jgi:hypothetical protein
MGSDQSAPRPNVAQAWQEFCQALRQAGDEVLRQSPPGDELDRAEGFRYLSRLTRTAFEQAFEGGTPGAPRLEPMYAQRTSIAQRNPDQAYLGARLAAEHDYRVSGRRGSGGALSFVSRASGRDGGVEALTGYLDDDQLSCSSDGTFQVTVSQRRHAGNWLPMSSSTDSLMVRELFGDPRQATPSVLSLERVDGRREEEPLTADAVARSLRQAGGTVTGLLERFGQWTSHCAEETNRFWTTEALLGRGEILRLGGSPGIDYCLGYWRVAPDEALVIDVVPQREDRWSFQVMNHWQESLNLPWCSSHVNAATAHSEMDGSVRLVVAGRRPAVANWIDTAGHDHGVMLFRRFGGPTDRALPRCQLVGLVDLVSERPTVTDDRSRQIAPGYLTARIG